MVRKENGFVIFDHLTYNKMIILASVLHFVIGFNFTRERVGRRSGCYQVDELS